MIHRIAQTHCLPPSFGSPDPLDPSLTPDERSNAGWIGQVPPPPPAAPPCTCSTPPAPTYANPQIAPDPWLNPGIPGMNDDPTLFG